MQAEPSDSQDNVSTESGAIQITFAEDASFDVGRDTRTGVAMLRFRYEVPSKFTGKIDKLTFKLEPFKLEPKAATEDKAELAPMEAPEPEPIDETPK